MANRDAALSNDTICHYEHQMPLPAGSPTARDSGAEDMPYALARVRGCDSATWSTVRARAAGPIVKANGEQETRNRELEMYEPEARVAMKGDDIAARLVALGVSVIKILDALPQTAAGRHVAGQLLRSGTSAGANYEEARGAESRQDFVHTVGIALKELQETRYWLHLIAGANLAPNDVLRVGALRSGRPL